MYCLSGHSCLIDSCGDAVIGIARNTGSRFINSHVTFLLYEH